MPQAVRRVRPEITPLEIRDTPATVTLDAAGVLFILGTRRADVILVSRQDRQIVVSVFGRTSQEYRFDAETVNLIDFFGGTGNDVVANDTAIRCYLDAGAGNDRLSGGQNADTLLGGAGNDLLAGGPGADVLIGGPGRTERNQLFGGEGFDALITRSPRDRIEPGPQDGAPDEALALEIVRLTNVFRQQSGRRSVRIDARLVQAAQGHAENMARQGVFDHVLDGRGPTERAAAAGYPSRFVGENIVMFLVGYDVPITAMELWKQSPGHRANMLVPGYRNIGIGIARSTSGMVYVVQLFGG